MSWLRRLLCYIMEKVDGWIVFRPEGWKTERSVDAEKLMEYLRGLDYVARVWRQGNYVYAELRGRVSKYLPLLRSDLEDAGFDVPVSTAGKYIVRIPVEYKVGEVTLSFSPWKEGVGVCITASGSTYPVREELKRLGYKFTGSAWTWCGREPERILRKLKDTIAKLADTVPVRISESWKSELLENYETSIENTKANIQHAKSAQTFLDALIKAIWHKAVENDAKTLAWYLEDEEWMVRPAPTRTPTVCFKPKRFIERTTFRALVNDVKKLRGYYESGYGFCIPLTQEMIDYVKRKAGPELPPQEREILEEENWSSVLYHFLREGVDTRKLEEKLELEEELEDLEEGLKEALQSWELK